MINVLSKSVVEKKKKHKTSSEVVFNTLLAGPLKLWDEQGKTLNCSSDFFDTIYYLLKSISIDYVTMALENYTNLNKIIIFVCHSKMMISQENTFMKISYIYLFDTCWVEF